jgi:hypothetical protein
MSDIAEWNCCIAGRPYAAPVKAESRPVLLSYTANAKSSAVCYVYADQTKAG